MLAGHDCAAEVDGSDVIECSLGNLVNWRVPAGDAYADIVVEHVNSAPTLPCGLDHGRERRLVGNVRSERNAFSTRVSCHYNRFLGGGKVVVDSQYVGAFLSKTQNRGAA